MHKLALKIFDTVRDLLILFKILCIFCLLIFLLFWIQNIIEANWTWMEYFRPILNYILAIANNINSDSFYLFGATVQIKYLISCALIITTYFLFHLTDMATEFLKNSYIQTNSLCKRVEEKYINHKLHKDIEKEELSISKFAITINTRIRPKFANNNFKFDITEQNKILIDYLEKQLHYKPYPFDNGYICYFPDFNDIDKILEVLFHILQSNAPIECSFCVQINNILSNLKKLIKLEYYGKIVMCADTKFRYSYNKYPKFDTNQIGIFQSEDKTIEVHEFKEFS